jgi:hypothetical protein
LFSSIFSPLHLSFFPISSEKYIEFLSIFLYSFISPLCHFLFFYTLYISSTASVV